MTDNLYRLVIRNKAGEYVDVGMAYPMTHAECMTMKSKFSTEQQSRMMVVAA